MIFLVLVLLAMVGLPLFAVIAIGALAGYRQAELEPNMLAMEFSSIGEMPLLIALPLFVFAGLLVCRSKIPERLADIVACSRHFPALPLVLAFGLLSALIGMIPMAFAFLASALLPALAGDGVAGRGNQDAAAAGAGLGMLMAPSILLVVYAAMTHQIAPRFGVDLHALVLAGLFAALLILVLLAWRWVDTRPMERPAAAHRRGFARTHARVGLELPLPFLVIGGMYSGWLPVIEASLLTAMWLIVTLVIVRGDVGFKALAGVVRESMMLTAAIVVLLGLSLAAGSILTDAGFVQQVTVMVGRLADSPLVLVLLLAALLIMAGVLLDVLPAMVVLAPLMLPVTNSLDVDPLHLGIVMSTSLATGCLARPLLLGDEAAGRLRHEQSIRVQASGKFIFGMLLIVLIVAIWPQSSLWLPGRFAGGT